MKVKNYFNGVYPVVISGLFSLSFLYNILINISSYTSSFYFKIALLLVSAGLTYILYRERLKPIFQIHDETIKVRKMFHSYKTFIPEKTSLLVSSDFFELTSSGDYFLFSKNINTRHCWDKIVQDIEVLHFESRE